MFKSIVVNSGLELKKEKKKLTQKLVAVFQQFKCWYDVLCKYFYNTEERSM